jgi:hypothetical protein
MELDRDGIGSSLGSLHGVLGRGKPEARFFREDKERLFRFKGPRGGPRLSGDGAAHNRIGPMLAVEK